MVMVDMATEAMEDTVMVDMVTVEATLPSVVLGVKSAVTVLPLRARA